MASRGAFEIRDRRFIFYLSGPVLMDDQISFQGELYKVVEIEHWSEQTGRCQVIAKEIT
jgi:hypothetical protein